MGSKENIERLYVEWQSLQPISEEAQNNINRKFMLEFNYNSNHIEGNTLTYGQTELLLMFGQVDGTAKMHDLEEMKAHNVGLKMMQEEAEDKERPLTEYFIRELHRTLLREDYVVNKNLPDGTTTTYTVHAGRYKTRPNSVTTVTGEKFEYASPEETPALMTSLVEWYNKEVDKGELSAIELATLFHYRYIRIHPFEDGNGRIARLLVNFILLRAGYPMIIVRSSDKESYLSALNICDVNVGLIPSLGANAKLEQITPFVSYMAKCLERALDIRIRAAKGENIDEDDDWRKKLLTEHRNSMNHPERTDDVMNEVLSKSFKPLLERIDKELSPFYSVFESVEWKSGKCEFESAKTKVSDDVSFYSLIKFKGITKTLGLANELPIFILVEFEQFKYSFNVCISNLYVKKELYSSKYYYTQKPSEKDFEDIVNTIGKYLVDEFRL